MNKLIKTYYSLYSPLVWLYLIHNKVSFKKICYFCGFPYIKNRGSIKIGAKCRFMSKETGNAIGLAHRCMLTTETKDAKLTIGKGCGFSGSSIWCFKEITIGNNVRVGANCLIMDGDAHQDDPRAGLNKPIHIEDNVWLGANVVVMKGVNIGRNSLIGMNSVVTKDIPANVIAAGNPCKVIRELTPDQIEKLEKK